MAGEGGVSSCLELFGPFGRLSRLALLFGLPCGAGGVAGGYLLGGHGLDELGSELLVAGGLVEGRSGGGDLLFVLGGVGLVRPDRGLVVAVTAGDPLIEGGGGLFVAVGFGHMAVEGGGESPLGGSQGCRPDGLVGPLGAGHLRFGPPSGRFVPPGAGSFDLARFAGEAAGAGVDNPGVVTGSQIVDDGPPTKVILSAKIIRIER
ncbi:MAG: hypothetical protein M0Z30_22150 [Actinomycetota bacterium]|nr:hypothetical protein [Actinomycetota bacterium]